MATPNYDTDEAINGRIEQLSTKVHEAYVKEYAEPMDGDQTQDLANLFLTKLDELSGNQ